MHVPLLGSKEGSDEQQRGQERDLVGAVQEAPEGARAVKTTEIEARDG